MSRGVPNVVSVVKSDSTAPPSSTTTGTSNGGSSHAAPRSLRMSSATFGYAATSCCNALERRIVGEHHRAPKLVQQVGRPRREVPRVRREPFGVEADAVHVQRRAEELDRQTRDERARGPVREHDVPVPVDHEAWVGVVRVEQALDRRVHHRHRRVGERRLAVARRVSGGKEHRVPLAERDIEALGEGDHQLGARLRATGLDEAQVARRDPDLEREVELGPVTSSSPLAHERADCFSGHVNEPMTVASRRPLPNG